MDVNLNDLFGVARSQNGWSAGEVSDDDLRRAYEIAKWGPTSMNSQPLRVIFARSEEAKARLAPAVAPGNAEKVATAPVVAIFAHDLAFFDELPRTFPHNPAAREIFASNEALAQSTAFRNGTLQTAYFMITLRAIGFDVGPMSGFNPAIVDQEFFPNSTYRANFLCGIGRGDPDKVMERLPRLDFKDVAEIL